MELKRTDPDSFVVLGNAVEAETMRLAMTQPANQGPREDEPRARAHERLRLPAVTDPWEARLSQIELIALQRAVSNMQYQTHVFDADHRTQAATLTQQFIQQGKAPENRIYFSY